MRHQKLDISVVASLTEARAATSASAERTT
jgi:hypothetical protein